MDGRGRVPAVPAVPAFRSISTATSARTRITGPSRASKKSSCTRPFPYVPCLRDRPMSSIPSFMNSTDRQRCFDEWMAAEKALRRAERAVVHAEARLRDAKEVCDQAAERLMSAWLTYDCKVLNGSHGA